MLFVKPKSESKSLPNKIRLETIVSPFFCGPTRCQRKKKESFFISIFCCWSFYKYFCCCSVSWPKLSTHANNYITTRKSWYNSNWSHSTLEVSTFLADLSGCHLIEQLEERMNGVELNSSFGGCNEFSSKINKCCSMLMTRER